MVIKINKAICSKCNKKQSVKGFYEQRCKYCGSISLFIGNDMDSMDAVSKALIDFHAARVLWLWTGERLNTKINKNNKKN